MSKYAAWKGTERRIAKRLGGHRIGQHGGPVDVDAGWLQAQVKHRKTLPKWMVSALCAARAAAGDTRLGVVVLHEHGKASDGDVVVVSFRDWLDWFGGSDG
jgi:hypothetical protein